MIIQRDANFMVVARQAAQFVSSLEDSIQKVKLDFAQCNRDVPQVFLASLLPVTQN
jgi:hypothetical protein